MDGKPCSACGTVKLLDDFHKDKTKKDGRTSTCKICARERTRKWTKANPEQARTTVKACWLKNKDSYKKQQAEYRDENHDKIQEGKRRYYQVNKEKIYILTRNWKKANKAKESEYHKKWKRNNKDTVLAGDMRRRARRRNAPVIENVSRMAVYERDNGICYLCDKPVALEDLHIDHVIPLSRNGEHSYRNMKTAHAECNLRKGTKLPTEMEVCG